MTLFHHFCQREDFIFYIALIFENLMCQVVEIGNIKPINYFTCQICKIKVGSGVDYLTHPNLNSFGSCKFVKYIVYDLHVWKSFLIDEKSPSIQVK